MLILKESLLTIKIKISQYADDTTFILNGTRNSLSATLDTLEKFGSVSGLRLNNTKTEALWIGSMTGENKKLFPILDGLKIKSKCLVF